MYGLRRNGMRRKLDGGCRVVHRRPILTARGSENERGDDDQVGEPHGSTMRWKSTCLNPAVRSTAKS